MLGAHPPGPQVLLYALRVWMLRGFYIVTYGLGIYNLNLVLVRVMEPHRS